MTSQTVVNIEKVGEHLSILNMHLQGAVQPLLQGANLVHHFRQLQMSSNVGVDVLTLK
jgi:hypothetical protein